MRPWTVALIVLFFVALLAPAAQAEPCEEGDERCTPGEDQSGDGDASGDANRTEGNGTPAEDPDSERSDERERKDARAAERDRRKAEAWQAYRGGAERTDVAHEREERRADLPDHVRERLGLLVTDDDGYRGTYVDFEADPQHGILEDIRANGLLLFQSIYPPVGLDETATVTTTGNTFAVSGSDWSFRLTDHTTGLMRLHAAPDDPFRLFPPAEAGLESTGYGMQITYAGMEGTEKVAHLRGDVREDPDEPGVLVVFGQATYHVANERTLLPAVSNRVLPDLEEAITDGRFGAEVTVLRAAGAVYEDVLLYEDLVLDLQEESREDQGAATYTITVDSESHPGKTIAVAFEKGLVDPDTLLFQYYNVEEDVTTEAPIRQAASLADVLDPLDDGTVAEYWIVEDADGVQVLMSIPHFSVHQIRLTSLVDVLVEQPSLVVGTVGAVLLVSVATMGLFRRPEDDV